MNEQELFVRKLSGIDTFAAEKDGVLTETEIQQYFDGITLNDEQWELVYTYLQNKHIHIAGRKLNPKIILSPEEMDASSENTLFDEDEVLQMYLEDLKDIAPAAEGEERHLYIRVSEGDQAAVKRLSELYLYTVIAIAKEYAKGSIPVGDLIQEGNLGLLMGISMLSDKPEDVSEGDYLVGSIRESIEMYILEQGDQSAIGKKAVEKADKLHKAIRKLEEELEHKVTKAGVSAFLNIPVEEIDEVIRLSGENLGL